MVIFDGMENLYLRRTVGLWQTDHWLVAIKLLSRQVTFELHHPETALNAKMW